MFQQQEIPEIMRRLEIDTIHVTRDLITYNPNQN